METKLPLKIVPEQPPLITLIEKDEDHGELSNSYKYKLEFLLEDHCINTGDRSRDGRVLAECLLSDLASKTHQIMQNVSC